MGTPFEFTVGGRTLYSSHEGSPDSVLPMLVEEFDGIKTAQQLKAKLLDMTDVDEGFELVGPWGSNAHYSYEYDHKKGRVKVENTFSHPHKVLFEGPIKDAIKWADGDDEEE